ncbi:inorganic phosphate transporter [Tsukamurella sp. 8F]|uniref:inorganic phosphate transporter n=1 Tax=unclassified Tsukamurella TaxID=2633480 RepID=UPI0023B9A831|nr:MULTISPECIES: inorganic phosphate transporter [unclassified Tsukamurella]MDF0531643.1 inorganic phosphate transporter [Tsukamurella sp. 8J]MDF0588789.1 inorganic phosphate transporter [Tsukamurella sp. 8F]
MNSELIILLLVIVIALAFDFTNGFHDTGNAMATSIATGALKPKTAVTLSAILNLVGAFLSVEVALTVTNSVIKIQDKSGAPKAEFTANHGRALLVIVMAGLVGGIVWNLLTWLLGLPSSSSHALFGGLIGAALAALGISGVVWNGHGKLDGVFGKVILPALFSPVIAGVVAAIGTFVVFKIVTGIAERFTEEGFRWGQIGTASMVSLAHGTGDAQKTMGVITLALIGYSASTPDSTGMFAWHSTEGVPVWVKFACALAIALGTYIGGWRIIRTLGKGLIEITPQQGMAAEAASATVILVSSHLGFALSTTHVATGSILGAGVGKPGAQVRWGVALRMVTAWVITLPAAAVVGAIMWFIAHYIPGIAGPLVVFAILLGLAGYMYYRAQQQKVDAGNVNAEWDESGSIVPADQKIAKV